MIELVASLKYIYTQRGASFHFLVVLYLLY